MNDNLALWRAVEKTDPAATKQFRGKGGFAGTAISPMWLIRLATQQWGPMGDQWGIEIVQEKIVEGAPLLNADGVVVGRESIHMVQAYVWYNGQPGKEASRVPCFGQTEFCGQRKNGDFFTDEEAPKKSLTDALTKGLSWLGFAADVHMGRFDDVKYVNQVKQEFEEAAAAPGLREKALAVLEPRAREGIKALELAWKGEVSEAMRKACKSDLPRLKEMASA